MTKEELKEKISEIIYMYAHGVEEDAMTNGEATDKILGVIDEMYKNGKTEAVNRMLSEAWKCRFMEYDDDRFLVSHGDLVSIGNEILNNPRL